MELDDPVCEGIPVLPGSRLSIRPDEVKLHAAVEEAFTFLQKMRCIVVKRPQVRVDKRPRFSRENGPDSTVTRKSRCNEHTVQNGKAYVYSTLRRDSKHVMPLLSGGGREPQDSLWPGLACIAANAGPGKKQTGVRAKTSQPPVEPVPQNKPAPPFG